MSKNEVHVQWISALVLVLKATLALPPAEALPRDYYMLHLRNPLMRYHDYLIYSMGTDDTLVINTVPNLLPGLRERLSVPPNSHATSSSNHRLLDYMQFKNNRGLNISGLARRVPVFEHYDFNKRRYTYLKPVSTAASTTASPFGKTWKPVRGNEQTFDIQLTKSITVSSPGKWVSSVESVATKPSPKYPPRSPIPSREAHAKYLDQESSPLRNSSYDHPVKLSNWKPYPGHSQNAELSFQKAFAPFRDSKVGQPNGPNNDQPQILFRVNHSFKNAKIRVKDTNASVPHFKSNARHSVKLSPRNNRPPIRTTKATISPRPSIVYHRQQLPKTSFRSGQDRKENFRSATYVSNKHGTAAVPGNVTELDNGGTNPRWIGRHEESRLSIQPLFEHNTKGPQNDLRLSTESYPNNKESGWKEFFESGRLNPTIQISPNKTHSPTVITHSPFSNQERRQSYLPKIELSTVSVSLSKFPRKYSQNAFEFTTTTRTYFAATIPTDLFPPVTENSVRVSSAEVIQDTTSAISNYILKNDNQELSESGKVDVRRVPETPEVKRNKPPVSGSPKVKISGGVLAGVLIASLIFLGFLTGAAVYTFHQWKFSKYRKNSRKGQPTYSSEYLDNSFTGNTYIHNNIYLPTPQNIEEVSSVDSDSFISGIEAVTVENYASENAKSTAV